MHHSKFRWLMSALGQKRTLKRLHPMSALPPKADIGLSREMFALCQKRKSATCLDFQLLRHEASLPALIHRGLGYLAVSSGNQRFGDQQKSREDHGVNHRDRDYADGKLP